MVKKKEKEEEERNHGSAQISWDGDAQATAMWEAGDAGDAPSPGERVPCWQQGWVPQGEERDTSLPLDVLSVPEPRLGG